MGAPGVEHLEWNPWSGTPGEEQLECRTVTPLAGVRVYILVDTTNDDRQSQLKLNV